MRALIVLAAVLAAACSVDVGKGHGHGGYSVEIRSVGDTQLYVVRGPEGKVAAAHSGDGESTILNTDQLQHALAAMPTPSGTRNNDDQSVSIHAPGFNMRVQGDDIHHDTGDDDNGNTSTTTAVHAATSSHDSDSDDDDGDHVGHGNVTMNIGGFGMQVNADDGGPGSADDRAQVTLTGMSAEDVRKFIVEQDDLSPQVQSQMLAALGMPQDASSDDDHRLAGGNGGSDTGGDKPKP